MSERHSPAGRRPEFVKAWAWQTPGALDSPIEELFRAGMRFEPWDFPGPWFLVLGHSFPVACLDIKSSEVPSLSSLVSGSEGQGSMTEFQWPGNAQ
jgi:hypothetical protein